MWSRDDRSARAVLSAVVPCLLSIVGVCGVAGLRIAGAQEEEYVEWFDPGPNYWPAGDGSVGRYPTYDFYVDLLYLDRQTKNDNAYLFDDSGAALLTGDDVNLRPEVGVRLGGMVMDPDGWELELGFFTLGQTHREFAFSSANGTNIFPGLPSTQSLTLANYLSRTYGGEINLRYRLLPQFTLLSGLRLASIEESLSVSQSVLSGPALTGSTDNNLTAAQVGMETMLLSRSWVHLIGSMKYAVGGNRSEFNVFGTNLLDGSTVSARMIDTQFATIGEGLVGLEFPLGPFASLRLGYQVMWFQGVALAADQEYLAVLAGTSHTSHSVAVYHGGFLGFEAAF